MPKLPQGLEQIQMENTWASIIEPVLNSPMARPVHLKNVSLAAGSNTVNHRLGRKLVGWISTRLRANVTVYDTQDSNPNPQLTLTLEASGPVVIDLVVF